MYPLLAERTYIDADNCRMPAAKREFWTKAGDEIKVTKDSMQPLLHDWLMTSIQGTLCIQIDREKKKMVRGSTGYILTLEIRW